VIYFDENGETKFFGGRDDLSLVPNANEPLSDDDIEKNAVAQKSAR
jgi:hypothetical protein